MNLRLESYHPDQAPKPSLQEACADLFRETFNNPPYAESGQFVAELSSGKYLGPQAFGVPLDHNGQARLKDMDRVQKTELNSDQIFVHDPERVRTILKEKLSKAYSALLLEGENLRGFAFAYPSTVKRSFQLEEWGHPFNYASEEDRQKIAQRSFEDFLACLALEANTPIICSNCVLVSPRIHGQGWGSRLLKKAHSEIPEDSALFMLGETSLDSTMHGILSRRGFSTHQGFLPEPLVLMKAPLKAALEGFRR